MYLEGQFFGVVEQNGTFRAGLHRTDNGTATAPGWTDAAGSQSAHLPPGIPNAYYTIDPADGNHLLARGDHVYETKNGGDTWTAVGPVANEGQAGPRGVITTVVFRPGTDSQTWMAGTSQGELWYHSAAGWVGVSQHTAPDGTVDSAEVRSMAFAPTDNRVLYVLYASANAAGRVYRVELKGNVWAEQPIGTQLPGNVDAHVICGDAWKPTVVYVGTHSGMVRGERTPGLDYSSTAYNDGFPLVLVEALTIDKSTGELRAGTNGRGAWAVVTGP